MMFLLWLELLSDEKMISAIGMLMEWQLSILAYQLSEH